MKRSTKKRVLAKKAPVALKREAKARGLGKATSVRSIRLLERRYKILALRKEGLSMKEIADHLGIGACTVSEDLRFILKMMTTEFGESIEDSRQLQLVRLDALLKKYQPLAEAGNLSAAAMVLNIETRRSKLLALDTPETRKKEETGVREYVGVNVDDV